MKEDKIKELKSKLQNSDRWITADELASSMNVTRRTIRNYIKKINDASHTPLIESGANGYRWNITASSPLELYVIDFDHIVSNADRYDYIIRVILSFSDISIDDILNALHISEHTFYQDLSAVKSIIRPYGIRIQTRRNQLYLLGTETSLRRLSFRCIHNTSKVTVATKKLLCDGFPDFDIDFIYSQMNIAMQGHNLKLYEFWSNHFYLSVLVQLYRISHGHSINCEEVPIPSVTVLPEYLVACEFAKEIEETYGLHLNRWEVQYLTGLIISTAENIVPVFPEPVFDPYPRLHELAVESLSIVDTYLDINYFGGGFPSRLTDFFFRMLIRNAMQLDYPLLSDSPLRSSHPLIMDLAAEILLNFKISYAQYSYSNDVGILALLLTEYLYGKFLFESKVDCTLIIPALGNLGNKIIDRINKQLGAVLNIRQIISSTDIDMVEKEDLIISLLPVKHSGQTVVISAMPISSDFRNINAAIRKIKNQHKLKMLDLYLRGYFRPELLMFTEDFAKDKETIIHKACTTLMNVGCIDEYFESAVLSRESMSSTIFSKACALPHHCGEHVKKNAICIILDRNTSIEWDNTHLSCVVLFALTRDLLHDFQNIYNIFVSVFSNPKNIQQLQTASSYEDIFDKIKLMRTDD